MKSLVAATYNDMKSGQFCKASYMMKENGSEGRSFIFILYRILFWAICIGQIKLSQKLRNGNKKIQAIMYTSLANSNEVTLSFLLNVTAWKVFVYGVILVLIQSKCGTMQTRKTLNTDTFHVLCVEDINCISKKQFIIWIFLVLQKNSYS